MDGEERVCYGPFFVFPVHCLGGKKNWLRNCAGTLESFCDVGLRNNIKRKRNEGGFQSSSNFPNRRRGKIDGNEKQSGGREGFGNGKKGGWDLSCRNHSADKWTDSANRVWWILLLKSRKHFNLFNNGNYSLQYRYLSWRRLHGKRTPVGELSARELEENKNTTEISWIITFFVKAV